MPAQVETPSVSYPARAFVALQKILPTLLLTTGMHHLTRVKQRAFKNAFIRVFMRMFDISLEEAEVQNIDKFKDFNEFFTRALKPGVRPLAEGDNQLLCPADGRVSQFGKIQAGRLLQAKGIDYSAAALLGDAERAAAFENGDFCTVYLAPYNYHRLHMPVTATLTHWRYDPGRLFSVNAATAMLLPGLFHRNERLTAFFDTDYGPMAMVLVGALMVGGLETVWSGPVTPPHGAPAEGYEPMRETRLPAGAEMGRFNMGSTVILLSAPGAVRWSETLQAGQAVQMGQSLGRWQTG